MARTKKDYLNTVLYEKGELQHEELESTSLVQIFNPKANGFGQAFSTCPRHYTEMMEAINGNASYLTVYLRDPDTVRVCNNCRMGY